VSFYRAVNMGLIPFEEERKPWQKRAVKRFRLDDVRTALDRMARDGIAPRP
jgi:hypothetical protein